MRSIGLIVALILLVASGCSPPVAEQVNTQPESNQASPTKKIIPTPTDPPHAATQVPVEDPVASEPDLDLSALSGQIIFASDRDGNWEIYSTHLDGSDLIRLTENEGIDWSPSVSPDGNRVAFASDRDGLLIESPTGLRGFQIYVMNLDGTGLTKLTQERAFQGSPAWSPQGSQIAFDSDRGGSLEVYLMGDAGANQLPLTFVGTTTGGASWSPDGQKLAFGSHAKGQFDIYTMNADGSEFTLLTDHPENDRHAAWSPDGTRIAFVSERDGNREIYVVNIDGSNLSRLTSNPSNDNRPAWSPDGEYLVFTSDRDGNEEIYVINADGTALGRLTDDPARDSDPHWFSSP